ncbi:MAG: glycosyltransferase family 2 protein [Patescibacteria group bacterium]|jgi:glycosyltransferase involved in cell wall biosynthesis
MLTASHLPKISIVIPSYNQGSFIAATIRSVLDQNYSQLELIVIDGGSTDQTLQVLKEFGNRIQWVSEKDAGQSDAINKGLRRATGEIIGYLNSDDLLLPGSLNRVANFFQTHPDNQWVTGLCRIVNEKGVEINKPITMYKNFLLHHYRHWTLLVTDYISQMSTFWRADVMQRIGLYSVSEHLVMDYDYWLRLSVFGPPGIIDDYLSCFRIHSSSKSVNRTKQQFHEMYLVAGRHTNNRFILFFNLFHGKLTLLVYRFLTLLGRR